MKQKYRKLLPVVILTATTFSNSISTNAQDVNKRSIYSLPPVIVTATRSEKKI